MNDALTGQTVELLQQLIRNRCVNDGTVESGQEVRTTDVLRTYLEGSGLDVEVYEPDGAPGRTSLVARIEGTDPTPPTLCHKGHTHRLDAFSSGEPGGVASGDQTCVSRG